MIFKKVKNRICVASLGVLAGLLLVFCSPLDTHAEEMVVASKEIKHVHSSTNTTPCYSKHWGQTGTEYKWKCTICGDEGWGVPYLWDTKGHGDKWGIVDSRPTYGDIWELTCTHSNETIGSIAITKDKKNLTLTASGSELTIQSVTWSGSASGTGISVVATKTGTATATVVIKDGYSKKTSTYTLTATLTKEDFFSCSVTADNATTTSSWAKSATLACVASGEEVASYQWYYNGEPLSQAQSNKRTALKEGDYYCIATSTEGTVAKSNVIHLYIDTTAPTFGTVTYDGSKTVKELETTVTYDDSSSTGVSGVKKLVITKDGVIVDEINVVPSETEFVFFLHENGTYTFTLHDNAGNTSTKNITVSNIDATAPEIGDCVLKNEDGSITPTYFDKKVIYITASDNNRLTSVLCAKASALTKDANGNYSLIDSNPAYINASFSGKKTTTESFTLESEEDNCKYIVIAYDEAGNQAVREFTISEIDTTAPAITHTRISSSSSYVVERVTFSDNKKMKAVEVALNGNIKNIYDVINSGSKELTLDNNGAWTFTAIDDAGHRTSIVIQVTGIIKNYALDEEASLYHVHYGANASTTANGCYDEPYQNWEVVGHHTESAHQNCGGHSIGVIGHNTFEERCGACGSMGRTEEDVYGYIDCNGRAVVTGHFRVFDCYAGSGASGGSGQRSGSATCGGYTRYWQEPDYGYVTRYTCNKLNNPLGIITLRKVLDGDYKLAIEDNTNEHSEIIGYSWTGRNTTANETEFPSIHPNGGEASSVTGQTDSFVIIPDFGYYTCTVTYRDKYSGGIYNVKFYYMVEDYDLEPPTVSLIENKLYSETLDFDDVDAFSEKVNSDEPFVTKYKEKTTLTFHLEDNMCLKKIKCISGNLTYEKDLPKGMSTTVDVTFTKNGTYTFELYDAIMNLYTFTVKIDYIDTENPVIKTYVSNPTYDKKSAVYTLQVASDDYSKMKYKWLRKDHETGKVEVYKDWNDEPFVNLKDNGSYAVMVADSVYYNAEETEPLPTESYLSRGGHKHIVILNKDFNEPRLNYYYCDTEPPKVTYELRPTPRFVIVTIKATDNQDTEDELKYTCDKNVKSDKNLFYVTQNGTYKFTVTDECGNSTTISVYVDFDALTGASPSIIKDLIITPLGKTYVSEGVTYSNTGYTYKPVFKDFVDTNFILTKWNEKGTYKQVYSYTVSENASDVLYSRYTKDETVNTGEIEYPTNIVTKSIDKEAPTLAINVKNKIAYITTSDKISGVGKIEVETMTAHSKNTSYVDYSEKRSTNVTYALPMDYNTIYGIKIFDNVGNEGLQYYVSTDGVLTGGINNLYVVIFVDGDGKQINEQYLIKGANAVAPEAPTKTGCTFTKWSCDYTNVNSNLLVYPVFTSNATGQILDEEIHYDESLRIKLKDSGFMFSNGGDGEIDEDKAERREIDDTVYLQETVSEDDYLLLNEDDTPKTFMKQYVYKYAGSSLIIMLLVLLAFKEWNERKRIK